MNHYLRIKRSGIVRQTEREREKDAKFILKISLKCSVNLKLFCKVV